MRSAGSLNASIAARLKQANIDFTAPMGDNSNPHPCPVVVLGWTGSKLRNLSRYCAIYSELGHPVLSYAPSIPDVWFQKRACGLSATLLDLAADMFQADQSTPQPLILHLASGAPYVFLPTAIQDDRYSFKGIVW